LSAFLPQAETNKITARASRTEAITLTLFRCAWFFIFLKAEDREQNPEERIEWLLIVIAHLSQPRERPELLQNRSGYRFIILAPDF
jgi:hypothetical protein